MGDETVDAVGETPPIWGLADLICAAAAGRARLEIDISANFPAGLSMQRCAVPCRYEDGGLGIVIFQDPTGPGSLPDADLAVSEASTGASTG